jgi:L-xylulokinase
MTRESNRPMLLGVDAGGTVVKAALFALDGRQLAVVSVPAKTSAPLPRHIERDMDVFWDQCAGAIRGCLAQADARADAVVAVGVAGHNDGLYLIDAAHRPVRPAIMAADSRAHAIVEEWSASGLARDLLASTGMTPGAGSPAALLTWLRRHEPESLARTRWILCCKDWLRLRLSGDVGTDETDAAALFCDVRARAYSAAVLERLGLEDIGPALPPIRASTQLVGEIHAAAASSTGLAEGTPVIAGAHDIDAGAVGAGAVADGSLSIMAGTWAINQLPVREARPDPRWQTRPFVLPERWLAVGASPASASALGWLMRELGLSGAKRYEITEAEVQGVLGDPSQIVFHPFLLGSPHGAGASAAFLGLRRWHTRAHLLRAAFEGVVCNHRTHVERLREGFALRDSARLCGGGARSQLWSQMFADGLGVEIEIPDAEEAGARGAATLAGLGAAVWPDLATACASTVRVVRRHVPTHAGRARMDELFDRYTRAHEALAPLWPELA